MAEEYGKGIDIERIPFGVGSPDINSTEYRALFNQYSPKSPEKDKNKRGPFGQNHLRQTTSATKASVIKILTMEGNGEYKIGDRFTFTSNLRPPSTMIEPGKTILEIPDPNTLERMPLLSELGDDRLFLAVKNPEGKTLAYVIIPIKNLIRCE